MIAVLADTHLPRGSRALPPACIELLARAALIVHAGDFTAVSVLESLEALGPPVVAVRGNVDDAVLQARLPLRTTVGAEGRRIGVVHDPGRAAGRHERLRWWFPGCSVIVYGHTHAPEVTRVGGLWIVNPGSPTERRRARAHTMIVLENGLPTLIEL